MQLVVNIIISASLFSLIGISFEVIYKTTKFFHFVHASLITLGSYFLYTFLDLNFNLPLSIFFSIICIVTIIIIIYLFIYLELIKRKASSLILLVTSIGLYIIIQNLVSLIWGDEKKSFHITSIKAGHNICGAYITDIQIITIVVCFLLFISTLLFQNRTRIGIKIRAVSSNAELANILGIEVNKVYIWTFILGSTLASIAGILAALDTGMTPTMGFKLFLFGVVALIIGGVSSIWGVVVGSCLLAIAQHFAAYYIDSKWMDAITYIILIIFIIWKPLGFSGKRLKKIEI
jgi:branched-chain amino acid transport system permease protein